MEKDAHLSKTATWKMFDLISERYDCINRILSLGIDHYWRRKMNQLIPLKKNARLLDLATGTGDQLISTLKHHPEIQSALGIDLSEKMLSVGARKIQMKSYAKKVELKHASALEIPAEDCSFDYATMSFGIRNVPDVSACLKEIYRVLKPEGKVFILEFSQPTHPIMRHLYFFYLRRCLPTVGGWISKNKQAYSYLNQSIEAFPWGTQFCSLLKDVGFAKVKALALTMGIVTIYYGERFD